MGLLGSQRPALGLHAPPVHLCPFNAFDAAVGFCAGLMVGEKIALLTRARRPHPGSLQGLHLLRGLGVQSSRGLSGGGRFGLPRGLRMIFGASATHDQRQTEYQRSECLHSRKFLHTRCQVNEPRSCRSYRFSADQPWKSLRDLSPSAVRTDRLPALPRLAPPPRIRRVLPCDW